MEIQRFGASKPLPIALSSEARTESAQLLNVLLADTMILYAMYKKHHCLVAGPMFYQFHLLFVKHAGEQLELIDLLAERVQSVGGIAVGDPRHAAELTRIPRPPDGAEEVSVMIGRLLKAHGTIVIAVREAIETTNRTEGWGTNDLLMSNILRRHELQVWFLSEHLVDVPLLVAWAYNTARLLSSKTRRADAVLLAGRGRRAPTPRLPILRRGAMMRSLWWRSSRSEDNFS